MKTILIIAIAVILILVFVYFFYLRPKIRVFVQYVCDIFDFYEECEI